MYFSSLNISFELIQCQYCQWLFVSVWIAVIKICRFSNSVASFYKFSRYLFLTSTSPAISSKIMTLSFLVFFPMHAIPNFFSPNYFFGVGQVAFIILEGSILQVFSLFNAIKLVLNCRYRTIQTFCLGELSLQLSKWSLKVHLDNLVKTFKEFHFIDIVKNCTWFASRNLVWFL